MLYLLGKGGFSEVHKVSWSAPNSLSPSLPFSLPPSPPSLPLSLSPSLPLSLSPSFPLSLLAFLPPFLPPRNFMKLLHQWINHSLQGYDLKEHRYVACKIHQLNKEWKEDKKANYIK